MKHNFVASVFIMLIGIAVLSGLIGHFFVKKETKEYSVNVIKESLPNEYGLVSIQYKVGKDTFALDFLTPAELDSVKRIIARK